MIEKVKERWEVSGGGVVGCVVVGVGWGGGGVGGGGGVVCV